MNRATTLRKLAIAASALMLGFGIGRAGAHGAARLLNPGDCRVNDSLFTTAGGGCVDLQTNRAWSRGSWDTAGHLSFSYYKSWCAGMAQGGYTDWRMPTVTELQTLANHETMYQDPLRNPSESTVHIQSGTPAEPKWTGTATDRSGKKVYQVDLRTGLATAVDTRTGPLAEGICVR